MNVIPLQRDALFYRLDENNQVRPLSMLSFLELCVASGSDLRSLVKATYVLDHRGVRMLVSTVFVPVDMASGLDDTPVVFETMILGGSLSESMWRYTNYEEALAGHEKVVNLISSECLQTLLPYKEAV